jgi:ribosome recycling factor
MINDIKKNLEIKMHKSIEVLKLDLAKVRTGRAHTGILDHVKVDYYGTPTAINQLAGINLMDARTIAVSPYEKKMLSTIEKAIRESDLGLNPSSQGDLIRVPMPSLTEERRRDLTKVVRVEAETARVSVRNIRRDGIAQLKELQKNKLISEDEERKAHELIQKITDRFVAEVDQLLVAKEAELMAV